MIEASVRKKLGQFSLDASLAGSGFICLAGRNGSGKTTMMKAVAGLDPLGDGFVKVNGDDVSALPAERRRIVMVTPSSAIPHLNVDSHISWGGSLSGHRPPRSRVDEVKSRLGIDYGGRVGNLSLGMKERVLLATALLSSCRVILVDEAFSNLHERDAFMGSYRELANGAGIDVVFSSQVESDGRLADQLVVIESGSTKRPA
jgi:molybdate/tungstate transport system ATP-binding protein